MKPEYTDWINTKLNGNPKSAKNQCSSWTDKMVEAFPELRRVSGWIKIGHTLTEHWWCETETGLIVDPTVGQFAPLTHCPIYEEYKGPEIVGKCLECGSLLFAGYCPPGNYVCSQDCGESLEKYYGNLKIFSRNALGHIIKDWKDIETCEYQGEWPRS